MNCRNCRHRLRHKILDLGFSPPSNAYIDQDDNDKPEIYYPLRVFVCDNYALVQTEDFKEAESLFTNDYAYYSSTSISWLKHARDFCEKIIVDLNLNKSSFVVEVASNDGYLLKNFLREHQ